MLQQIIALVIIAFFIWRLIVQWKKERITQNEFNVWMGFWFLGAIAIVFIKEIDRLVINLGLAGSGINFLLYLTVIILFYHIFKLRLAVAKTESNLTQLARKVALEHVESKSDDNKDINNKPDTPEGRKIAGDL